MMTRGQPEKRAKTRPATEDTTRVSEMPMDDWVLSPKRPGGSQQFGRYSSSATSERHCPRQCGEVDEDSGGNTLAGQSVRNVAPVVDVAVTHVVQEAAEGAGSSLQGVPWPRPPGLLLLEKPPALLPGPAPPPHVDHLAHGQEIPPVPVPRRQHHALVQELADAVQQVLLPSHLRAAVNININRELCFHCTDPVANVMEGRVGHQGGDGPKDDRTFGRVPGPYLPIS